MMCAGWLLALVACGGAAPAQGTDPVVAPTRPADAAPPTDDAAELEAAIDALADVDRELCSAYAGCKRELDATIDTSVAERECLEGLALESQPRRDYLHQCMVRGGPHTCESDVECFDLRDMHFHIKKL